MKKIFLTLTLILFIATTSTTFAARNLVNKNGDSGNFTPGSLSDPQMQHFTPGSLADPSQKNFINPTNAVICASGKIRNVAEIFTYFTCLISTSIIPTSNQANL